MPKQFTEKQVNAAIDELNRVRRQWLRRPGVTAVDVGYRLAGQKMTDELAIRVHVRRKLPSEALASYESFTSPANPQTLGRFPVDVIEAEYGPSLTGLEYVGADSISRTGPVDPLVGGVSVGHAGDTGTLGAIVWDANDGRVCLLSNWHVLVGSAAAAVGDPIMQPGPYDGGTAADAAATLKRWRLDSDMDAALGDLSGSRGYSRDILGLAPIAGVDESPALGTLVIKSGRTTGVTQGLIDGVSLSASIDYGSAGVVTFHNQLHIVPRQPWPGVDYEVSRGGDSGAIWVNEANNHAVGLHFAGETDPSPASEMAIANPIAKVMKGLAFTFAPVYVVCRQRIFQCPPRIIDCPPRIFQCPPWIADCPPRIWRCPPLICGEQIGGLTKGCFPRVVDPGPLGGDPIDLVSNPGAAVSLAALSPDARRALRKMLDEIEASGGA